MINVFESKKSLKLFIVFLLLSQFVQNAFNGFFPAIYVPRFEVIYFSFYWIVDLWGLLILVSWLKNHSIPKLMYTKRYLIFLGAVLLSTVFNVQTFDFSYLRELLLLIVMLFVIYPISVKFTKEEFLEILMLCFKWMIVFTTVLNIASILIYNGIYYDVKLPRGLHNRIYPYFTSTWWSTKRIGTGPRFNGLYLNLTIPGFLNVLTFIVATYMYDTSKRKPLLWLSMISSLWMIHLCDNRASYIGVTLYVFAMILYKLKKKITKEKYSYLKSFIGGLLVVGFFCFMQFTFLPTYRLYKHDLLDTLWVISSNRTRIWYYSILKANQKPIFGFGWIATPKPMSIHVDDCHCVFINLYLWIGIVGLICGVYSLVMNYIDVFKKRSLFNDKEYILFLSMNIVVLFSFLDIAIYRCFTPETMLFWMVLGYFTKYYVEQGRNDNEN